MTDTTKCPLCDYVKRLNESNGTKFSNIECQKCHALVDENKYPIDKINDTILPLLESPEDRVRIIGYCREQWENDLNEVKLNPELIKEVLSKTYEYSDNEHIERKFDKFLIYLKKKSEGEYEKNIEIFFKTDYPLAYALNEVEFIKMLETLSLKKYIRIFNLHKNEHLFMYNKIFLAITLTGLNYIKEKNLKSKDIFVALAFDSELKKILEKDNRIFIKDFEKETGFRLFTIDHKETNKSITDEMLASINKSKAVIADFSDNNNGAYFEAGYALGLKLEVIFICEDKETGNIKTDGKPEKLIDLVHFDTRQFSHILWKDREDLKIQLISRIQSTLNRPK
ncbi:MAG: hypothetical protein WC860_03470 [Candidatus Margulisiibacteriota bacterium]|jgi:nucleoside 2-deoxyribosyltransferase